MFLRKQKKLSLNQFLTQRGINMNLNSHLAENSIFLKKVLKAKDHKKNKCFKSAHLSMGNTPLRNNKLFNTIIKKDPNILDISIIKNKKNNKNLNNKCELSNNPLNELMNNNLNNSNIPFYGKSVSNRFFNTNIKKNKKNFSDFMKNTNMSSENLLKRYNKNNNPKTEKASQKKIKYLDVIFNKNPNDEKNHRVNKMIYEKKNNFDKFQSYIINAKLSRNNKRRFGAQNNSKSINNSISHSIDFSIIDKKENIKNISLSRTSDNFFILNNKTHKKIKSSTTFLEKTTTTDKDPNRNMKFLNHFIKYCYMYFILIVKKFFNNLKKIKIIKNEILNSDNKTIFNDFNKDDFDKETIKNKTSENFFEALDNNSFSFFSDCKKNYVYNRKKRINNQNFQEKNLLQLLNAATIERSYKRIRIDNDEKNLFDNENKSNDVDITQSPFFNKVVNKKDTISFNKKIEKNENNKIIGFIQINNEINPFDIKEYNINSLDNNIRNKISQSIIIPTENQQNADEILSFRKNINNIKIINMENSVTKDNKLNINIKYLENNLFKSSSKPYISSYLSIENFFLELIKNFKNVKKISARLIDSKLIKEKEELLKLNNINCFYTNTNLSVIKEEDSPIAQTFKKMENYYPISNNSKLFSKASIEKIIDGEKEINEENIDKILMNSLSDKIKYPKNKKLKKWQSQEIMVVSCFDSAMKKRRSRKENAKLLIEGLLRLIKFFSILCFNIRKEAYLKLKWKLKIKKFISYLIAFCIKREFT